MQNLQHNAELEARLPVLQRAVPGGALSSIPLGVNSIQGFAVELWPLWIGTALLAFAAGRRSR